MSIPFVYKLGGSSVSSIGSLQHFSQHLKEMGDRPGLVVVSALSKVTDSLVSFARSALEGQSETCDQITEQLRLRHLTMITQMFPSSVAPEVAHDVIRLLDALKDKAKEVKDDMGPREADAFRDQVLGYGEAMSSILVKYFLGLQHKNVGLADARTFLVTDDRFGDAEPLSGPTLARLEQLLVPLLQPGCLIVTQGFCGVTLDDQPTTLGRGGSDFSATYLGALLKAEGIEIRTDTPGVLSADPRLVDQTFTLREISHERASTLAHFGAKVLHHRCIEPVLGTDIPIRVLSSFDPEDPGTLICRKDQEDGFSVTKRLGWIQTFNRPDGVTSSDFLEPVLDLVLSHGVLASSVGDDKAWLAWSSCPKGAETTESGSVWEAGLLYIMTRFPDQVLLDSIGLELERNGVKVNGGFCDAQRGLVISFDPKLSVNVSAVAHRTMRQLVANLSKV